MIIFYLKDTGEIIGTVGGRIHQPEELKMWMGDPQQTERIIIEWKSTAWGKDDEGRKVATAFEPDCDEKLKPIIKEIEQTPMLLHEKYRVDPLTKLLRRKTKEELDVEAKIQEEMKTKMIERESLVEKDKKIIVNTTLPIEQRFEALVRLLNFTHQIKIK